MIHIFKKQKTIISLILIGIILRLIYAAFYNHMFDFTNILALSKSIADTGDLGPGFIALSKHAPPVQLYGKIYYQINALWLIFLEKIKLLEIKYIFDNKTYTTPLTYLVGFRQWGVPLYQLTAIKLIQFFWDFILLFSLYKISKELKIKNRQPVFLFWALNPFIMLIGYAIFMSDLALISLATLACYLWLKTIKEKDKKRILFLGCLTFLTLILGALIKQLTILLLPFAFISIAKNWRQAIFYLVFTISCYFLIGQYWSNDGVFFKHFFLLSRESQGLFSFTLNGVSVFFFLYLLLFTAIFYFKDKIFQSAENIIRLFAGVILVVYLSEESGLLFVQFYLWIIPFAFLLAYNNKSYYWLYTLAVLAMIIKIVVASDYLSTLLSPAIGAGFSDYIQNHTLMRQFFNPDIYGLFMHTVMIFFFLIMAAAILLDSFETSNKINSIAQRFINLSINKTTYLAFGLFIFLMISDFILKARFITIPQPEYQITSKEIPLTTSPLIVTINNPTRQTIRAIELTSLLKKFNDYDQVIFSFYRNGHIFYETKINDLEFPKNTDNPLLLVLKQPITESKFRIEIKKEQGHNQLVTYRSIILSQQINSPKTNLFLGYDQIDRNNLITAQFPAEVFPISFRGDYKFSRVLNALKFHFQTKPKFYFGYFLFIAVLVVIVIYIQLLTRRKNDTMHNSYFNK